jgi:hypothetical protein
MWKKTTSTFGDPDVIWTVAPLSSHSLQDPAVPLVVLLCTMDWEMCTLLCHSVCLPLSHSQHSLPTSHTTHTVSVFIQHESRPANSKSAPAFLGVLTRVILDHRRRRREDVVYSAATQLQFEMLLPSTHYNTAPPTSTSLPSRGFSPCSYLGCFSGGRGTPGPPSTFHRCLSCCCCYC